MVLAHPHEEGRATVLGHDAGSTGLQWDVWETVHVWVQSVPHHRVEEQCRCYYRNDHRRGPADEGEDRVGRHQDAESHEERGRPWKGSPTEGIRVQDLLFAVFDGQ